MNTNVPAFIHIFIFNVILFVYVPPLRRNCSCWLLHSSALITRTEITPAGQRQREQPFSNMIIESIHVHGIGFFFFIPAVKAGSLIMQALSVAASNEDYREVLKRQLYARARGQGDPVFSKPLTMPEEPIHEKSTLAEEEAEKSPAVAEAAGEVEEAAQELRLEVESTAGGKSARAAAAQRFRSRISPEVESALSMMNEVIGVFRGLESQQVGPSLPVLAELQTSAMVEKSPDPEEGDGKRRFSDEKPAESQLFAELR